MLPMLQIDPKSPFRYISEGKQSYFAFGGIMVPLIKRRYKEGDLGHIAMISNISVAVDSFLHDIAKSST